MIWMTVLPSPPDSTPHDPDTLAQGPSGPSTARGRATALAFEEAARRVIAEKGFLAATVADIAAEAGRSIGSFYNYYESKEELLSIWATQYRDLAHARSKHPRDITAKESVEFAVRAHWSTFSEHIAEMIGVSQMATTDPNFARHWRDLRQDAIAEIADAIERAQQRGYAPGLDPLLAASAIVAMMNQFCFVWLAQDGDGPPGTELDPEAAIATMTELWYRGIFWKDDRP